MEQRHPSVKVEISVQETALSLSELATGRLDLVLDQRYGESPGAPRPGTERHHLLEDEILLASLDSMPVFEKMEDLRAERWVLPRPESNICGSVLFQRCREAGFEPDTRFWINDYIVGLRFAAQGLGIAPVSPLVSPEPPDGVRYNRLNPPITRLIDALSRPGPLRPAVEATLGALRDARHSLDRDPEPLAASESAPVRVP